ncbi:MAG: DUF99 family protein [Candidatus Bathyarchaeia archaeon]
MVEVSLHADKPAIRALGISESFVKRRSKKSVLAGVVMRGDGIVDGFSFADITVGGMDATEGVLKLYRGLKRDDINLILLNGCIIAWYNVIDLNKVHKETGLPIIAVTYEESAGLEGHFRRNFPEDWRERVKVYRGNKGREEVTLKTGYRVFVRFLGMSGEDAKRVLNRFTVQGSVSEPLRVARLLARSLVKEGRVP